jgi:hypothetical protein
VPSFFLQQLFLSNIVRPCTKIKIPVILSEAKDLSHNPPLSSSNATELRRHVVNSPLNQ